MAEVTVYLFDWPDAVGLVCYVTPAERNRLDPCYYEYRVTAPSNEAAKREAKRLHKLFGRGRYAEDPTAERQERAIAIGRPDAPEGDDG